MVNINTMPEIINGSTGIIYDIFYGPGQKQNVDLPEVILFLPDEYEGPDLTESLVGI